MPGPSGSSPQRSLNLPRFVPLSVEGLIEARRQGPVQDMVTVASPDTAFGLLVVTRNQ